MWMYIEGCCLHVRFSGLDQTGLVIIVFICKLIYFLVVICALWGP